MDIYEIRVRSLLNPSWKDAFDVATFEHDHDRGETLLRGRLDQSQLQGILNRIHRLGLKLVAVNIIESTAIPKNKRSTDEQD
ncbi:hypothetical protein KFU94_64330 [Chloroflexi bacterium TSY]|nr:hypothetical protein [Chloroflexi bacterium TSY]